MAAILTPSVGRERGGRRWRLHGCNHGKIIVKYRFFMCGYYQYMFNMVSCFFAAPAEYHFSFLAFHRAFRAPCLRVFWWRGDTFSSRLSPSASISCAVGLLASPLACLSNCLTTCLPRPTPHPPTLQQRLLIVRPCTLLSSTPVPSLQGVGGAATVSCTCWWMGFSSLRHAFQRWTEGSLVPDRRKTNESANNI